MSPHTLEPSFYSYVRLRKPRLAHTVTRDFWGIFFFFFSVCPNKFWPFLGRSVLIRTFLSTSPILCLNFFLGGPNRPPLLFSWVLTRYESAEAATDGLCDTNVEGNAQEERQVTAVRYRSLY